MDHALAAGFTAMQYDFAVSKSAIAPGAWLRFEIVGRPPGAFRHPTQGLIDAVVIRTL